MESAGVTPTLTPEFWEEVFATEDPWQYGVSTYEKWKFELTLSLLPAKRIAQAVELGCAEGHLTAMLAPRVDRLSAIDISPTALTRARARCAGLRNVSFERLNIAEGTLPVKADLFFCSEVLFYLPIPLLEDLALRISKSLKNGGHVLLAHGNLVCDDRNRTGFDWGHDFGAETIGRVFAATDGLSLVRQIRTPLFTVQLFQLSATSSASKKIKPPLLEEQPIPAEIELPATLEKTIIWDGPVMTRAEAQATGLQSKIPILMYHSIADSGPAELAPYRISPAAFRNQLRYLRRHGFHSITLQEWADCIADGRPVPGRPVIITFDDGYQDFYENAWPALERADFAATVFVVTDKVGGVADWDDLAEPLRLMDWDQLRTVSNSGITIASHCAKHLDLSSLSPSVVYRECENAKQRLLAELGRDVVELAFPWGRSTPAARNAIAQCGYEICVRSWGGPSTLTDDRLNLARIEIEAGDDLEAFAKKLNSEPIPADSVEMEGEPRHVMDSHTTKLNYPQADGYREPVVPLHPAYQQQLAAELDTLVGQFVRLQNRLLSGANAPVTLQRRLASLFALPVTGNVTRLIKPEQEIISGTVLSFEHPSTVTLSVEPKVDHSLSPESYLNTIGISFDGESQWRMLATNLEWSELSLAERFQFSIYAHSNRVVSCDLALRLPRRGVPPLEVPLASFVLRPGERNAVASGPLVLPDFIELDTTQSPQFAVFFDTDEDLSLTFHYLNCYFA